jgi:hypothetical protein
MKPGNDLSRSGLCLIAGELVCESHVGLQATHAVTAGDPGPAVFHQHSQGIVIGLLTAVDQRRHILPTVAGRHILDRQVFPLGGPRSPQSMPETTIGLLPP